MYSRLRQCSLYPNFWLWTLSPGRCHTVVIGEMSHCCHRGDVTLLSLGRCHTVVIGEMSHCCHRGDVTLLSSGRSHIVVIGEMSHCCHRGDVTLLSSGRCHWGDVTLLSSGRCHTDSIWWSNSFVYIYIHCAVLSWYGLSGCFCWHLIACHRSLMVLVLWMMSTPAMYLMC